jgi:hypothetical protein
MGLIALSNEKEGIKKSKTQTAIIVSLFSAAKTFGNNRITIVPDFEFII